MDSSIGILGLIVSSGVMFAIAILGVAIAYIQSVREKKAQRQEANDSGENRSNS